MVVVMVSPSWSARYAEPVTQSPGAAGDNPGHSLVNTQGAASGTITHSQGFEQWNRKEAFMPKTIAQRISALEKMVAGFFSGATKTSKARVKRAKRATTKRTAKAKRRTKTAGKRAVKTARRKVAA